MVRLVQVLTLFIYSSLVCALQVGSPVPLCEAKILSNNQILNLKTYENKVLMVDFWATWCPPCKQSMPFLNALRNELHDSGFEIIAINVDEKPKDARAFLQGFPVDYVMAYDPQGDCPGKYDVKAMPSSYFFDRKGTLRYVHLGFRRKDEAEIRAMVLQLLQEKP